MPPGPLRQESACHRMTAIFNVTDEVTNAFYLADGVCDSSVRELVFKYDHQFKNVDEVESEIASEMCFITDTIDINSQMPRDRSADIVCKKLFFQN